MLITSSSLAAIMRSCKRQPSRLMRFLMDELNTVRGKRGTLPGLDTETMDAILCKSTVKHLYMHSNFIF